MKKEVKYSLVAKRLSMLQDDHNQSPLVVVPPKVPVQHESHKRGQVLSDDELVGENESIAPKMSRSHKRAKVVKNYESPTNTRETLASLQSKQRGRSTPRKLEEATQAKLRAKYPYFNKLMLKSHVSGGFWLGLPKKFCDRHLPDCDTNMVLVDEDGNESISKYLARKVGLSGGWRGFSLDHGLVDGDELTFYLIAPDKFKIYVKRALNSGDVKDVGLLPSHYGVGNQNSDDRTKKVQQTDPIQETQTSADKLPQSSYEPELVSEVLQGIPFSDNSINFSKQKSFENFNITLEGITIDSEFPENTRKKYYELCKTQKTVLHDDLLKGLNCNLVVGTILEVVNISDAISSCEALGCTSREDLKIWERTLEGIEFLGLKVGFLKARVKDLMGLDGEESNGLKETIIKRALAKERMKALEEKLMVLKETMEKINLEVDDELAKASARK